MTATKTAVQQIKHGMAKAFFASAWADAADQAGQPIRGEIFEQMPDDIDPAAIRAADTLAARFIETHDYSEPGLSDSQKLACLYMKAANLDPEGADRELTPENFGHYLAMQAMGHGVGLESFGYAVRDAFEVPYLEFNDYYLEREYFEGGDDNE